MKKFTFLLLTALALDGIILGFSPAKTIEKPAESIKWITFEEAVELNKTTPKKIAIDVFTEWCGWCKRMDAGAFQSAEVVKYMSANFYCVKLDAEQKADINWNGQKFNYVKPEGQSRGINTFAYSLLDGKMGYPTIVYLNEKFERIMISPGYKEVPDLMKELRFAAENAYEKQTWEEFKNK
jgi:thioredoxin-related protein